MAAASDCNTDNVIQTARMELRPLRSADGDLVHRMWTNPDVRRFLFDDQIVPRARVDEEIAASAARFGAGTCGLWAMRDLRGDALVGFCGYRPFHDPPQLQLLYGLDPACWGKGFATEAARAMLRHGFLVHGFDPIVACTDAPNVASVRVMERAGMRFEKRVMVDGLDTIYYVLSRAELAPG
jgi:ribosomal-protein-alanine N-acetyltransferase